MPHKIIYLITSLQTGGAEKVIVEMANWHATNGYSVTICTWDDRERSDHFVINNAVSRIRWEFPSATTTLGVLFRTISRMYTLRTFCRRTKPDIVISFVDITNIIAAIALWGTGVKLLVSERTDPQTNDVISSFWKGLRKWTYKLPNHVIAQTNRAALFLVMECKRTVEVIGNPISPPCKIDLPEEDIIVNVGRMDKNKAQDITIKAFALISNKYKSCKLVLLGSGPEEQNLQKLTNNLGISENVIFAGKVKNVSEWMARSKFMAHSSRIEGFPNVILEAMVLGKAVLSTDCPSGPSELIENGINGILVPVDDINRMASAMEKLLENSELRQKLGSRAALIINHYHIDAIMEKWNNLINK